MTNQETAGAYEAEDVIDWMPLGAKSVRLLTRQLKREIPKKEHALSGVKFVIIAKNAAHDDVLLSLPEQDKWAVCHMTWSKRRETPPWPATRVAESLADLIHGI